MCRQNSVSRPYLKFRRGQKTEISTSIFEHPLFSHRLHARYRAIPGSFRPRNPSGDQSSNAPTQEFRDSVIWDGCGDGRSSVCGVIGVYKAVKACRKFGLLGPCHRVPRSCDAASLAGGGEGINRLLSWTRLRYCIVFAAGRIRCLSGATLRSGRSPR